MDKAFKAPAKCLSLIPGPLIETSATKSRSHRSNWAVFKWTCDSRWYRLLSAQLKQLVLFTIASCHGPAHAESLNSWMPWSGHVNFHLSVFPQPGEFCQASSHQVCTQRAQSKQNWGHPCNVIGHTEITWYYMIYVSEIIFQSEIICGIRIYTLLCWWWWHPPRHVTVKHIAPSLAKMVRVQKTKNNEDPGGSQSALNTSEKGLNMKNVKNE